MPLLVEFHLLIFTLLTVIHLHSPHQDLFNVKTMYQILNLNGQGVNPDIHAPNYNDN